MSAVSDTIAALRSRTDAAFVALQDFHVHTRWSYEQLEKQIAEGRRFGLTNAQTGTQIEGEELAARLTGYRTVHLERLILQQSFTLFEAFFFDLLQLLLRDDIRRLSQDRQLTVGELIEAGDFDTAVAYCIREELSRVRYGPFDKWFIRMERMVRIGVPSVEDIASLSEIKASRDLVVHSDGTINAIYLSKAGPKARAEARVPLPVDYAYVNSSWQLPRKVCGVIATAIEVKLH